MQIRVEYLENLKIKSSFDNFEVISDQPIRYKGDATAPGPFDYFLASSVMCAAYFVKVYCNAREISTEGIVVTQNNSVNPDNRYHQDFDIQIELPDTISKKNKNGIIEAMKRCTVKRVIQNNPKFNITAILNNQNNAQLDYRHYDEEDFKTTLIGKDCTLEETITNMRRSLEHLGINIEIASWRNPIPHVWSVHIRDADSPLCFTNGKGSTKDAALCSALGEYFERMACNYFYNDYYLGPEISKLDFVHYPNEKWFKIPDNDSLPNGMMDKALIQAYHNDGELQASHLVDACSDLTDRGICSIPFTRQSDKEIVYIPVNLIGNLFVSNGMSAGNTKEEASVQALSEIFERSIKNKIITEQISLPDVPEDILKKHPSIYEAIMSLRDRGYPIIVKDASLGGLYPVMNVTLMNPNTGGVFSSFGSHPNFEVALERSLTELLQGRSFEGLNDMPAPSFNEFAICEHNNIIDHFIDSSGVISWNFFSERSDYNFVHWNFTGTTKQENDYLLNILKELNKEVYIAYYDDLGVNACRILVPNFSEIYLPEDLVWDNNNRSLIFRDDILNLHSLTKEALVQLYENLEESEIDEYMPISELIGIAFEQTDAWARMTIGELKCLINLDLGNLDLAKNNVEMLLTFNDNTLERKKFFQLLGTLLDIKLNDNLSLVDFQKSLISMYGPSLFESTQNAIEGKNRFYGLSQTNSNLSGLKVHNALLNSYQKLHKARAKKKL